MFQPSIQYQRHLPPLFYWTWFIFLVVKKNLNKCRWKKFMLRKVWKKLSPLYFILFSTSPTYCNKSSYKCLFSSFVTSLTSINTTPFTQKWTSFISLKKYSFPFTFHRRTVLWNIQYQSTIKFYIIRLAVLSKPTDRSPWPIFDVPI